MKVQDLYAQTTARIISELEAGTPPWVRPWKDSRVSGIGMLPSNLVTGRLYTGGNTLLLWMTAHAMGYPNQQWATFKQVTGIGARVKKGERASTVMFTKRAFKKDEETGEDKATSMVKLYSVFNLDQLEGVDDKYLHAQKPLDLAPPSQKLQEFITGTGMEVRFGYNEACYVPKLDIIKMPASGMFDDEDAFAGTLCHEGVHWTGHESRLARTFGKRFGDANYAVEELCALS